MGKKKELIGEIHDIGRKMSTATILFHQAVAKQAGLSGTDHKYLEVLFQNGAMTAGKMAELTGLTTGAVTGVIDRLEKKGLVKREKNPSDRRQVLVVLEREKAMERVGAIFQNMRAELEELYETFSTEELSVIKKHLEKTTHFFESRIKSIGD